MGRGGEGDCWNLQNCETELDACREDGRTED